MNFTVIRLCQRECTHCSLEIGHEYSFILYLCPSVLQINYQAQKNAFEREKETFEKALAAKDSSGVVEKVSI